MKRSICPRTSIVRIGPRQHPKDIRIGRIGDEALRVVQHVGIPIRRAMVWMEAVTEAASGSVKAN